MKENRYLPEINWSNSSSWNLNPDLNNDDLEDAVFINDIEWTDTKDITIYTNQNWTFDQSLLLNWVTWINYVDLNNDDNTIDNWAKDIIAYTKTWDSYTYQIYVYNKSTKRYVNVLAWGNFYNWTWYSTQDINWDWNLDLIFTSLGRISE